MPSNFLAYAHDAEGRISEYPIYRKSTYEALIDFLQSLEDAESVTYTIRKEVITLEDCGTVTVGAKVYSCEEVIALLEGEIGYSWRWPEYTAYDEYNSLNKEDQTYVRSTLENAFEACDGCGCYHETGSLSYSHISGDCLCDACTSEEEQANEEEEQANEEDE